jgi:hypothetical protein
MSLESLIRSIRPRERAGSQTAARYDFQAHYAILKLVELREGKTDFRIVFDMFDDIMVLDSTSDPKEARFYQLKSKDPGDWTMMDLCKKIGANPPRSIVSRLYVHISNFGAAVAETGLVSNAAYLLKLKDGSTSSGGHHRIIGSQLHADEITKISSAVTNDITPADVPPWLPKLTFIRTTLGVHEQDLLVIGRLQKHIERFDQTANVNISAIYQTLHASITQKTSFFQEGIDQQDALLRKSLTTGAIDELFLRAAGRRRSFIEDWEIIRSDLDKASMGSIAQVRFKTAALLYHKERNAGRARAVQLSSYVEQWISAHQGELVNCTTLLEIATRIRSTMQDNFGYEDSEILAALIVEAYEATNGQP